MTLKKRAYEVNFDGLVGPTHNYGGLSYGNIASIEHGLSVSNPRAALKQGLLKMKLLADMGVRQAVLPPHERPDMETLRRLGFQGSDSRIIEKVGKESPLLLAACYSASSMWAANAATVAATADSADDRVHVTPANLVSQFHRSIEAPFTSLLLKTILSDETAFVHHAPLPAGIHFSDEGAANHTRFCAEHGQPGVEFFVYGRTAFDTADQGPFLFPARQTREASEAIARLHQLHPDRTVFARQHPAAIDSGVFHNDVISVGNENLFFYHSQAFSDCPSVLDRLRRKFAAWCGGELILIGVAPEEVSIKDAVETYLFNSQLVTLPDRTMCLIVPSECRANPGTKIVLDRILHEDNPIQRVDYVDVRQSMKNGGGPACLRLRVVLTEEQISLTPEGIHMNDKLYQDLIRWGDTRYRDRLHPDDLADPGFPEEVRTALDELTQILRLGSLYRFQRTES